jgi:hypothetical protein
MENSSYNNSVRCVYVGFVLVDSSKRDVIVDMETIRTSDSGSHLAHGHAVFGTRHANGRSGGHSHTKKAAGTSTAIPRVPFLFVFFSLLQNMAFFFHRPSHTFYIRHNFF